jgi:hypothetical protein
VAIVADAAALMNVELLHVMEMKPAFAEATAGRSQDELYKMASAGELVVMYGSVLVGERDRELMAEAAGIKD